MDERLKSPLCVRLTTLSWCCIVGACGDDGTAGTDAQTTSTTTGDTTAESTIGSSTAPITTGTPTTGTSSTGTVTTDLSTTDPLTTGDTTTTGTTADTSTSDISTSTGPVETCMDAAQNQDETDIDCGGASCPACVLGQMCLVNLDCAEGACVGNLCTMIECLADADCDAQDGECLDATCDLNDFTCVTGPINEAGPCDDADLCSLTSLCAAGACVADELVDCSGLDSACATGACNPDDGACVAVLAKDGDACDDDNGCTADTVCTAGVCGDVNSPGYLLYEDFADNDAGWMMSQNWAIGPAVAGCGDPGTDHTATMDNGVAGVVIGGCAPTQPIDANNFFCLTSPAVDSTGLPAVIVNFWRDLHSDYAPYMKNKIEVWNGNAWVIIFETFGEPGLNDAMWAEFTYDITAHSNAALQVRWCYNIGHGGAVLRGSWNVDDILLGETVCQP